MKKKMLVILLIILSLIVSASCSQSKAKNFTATMTAVSGIVANGKGNTTFSLSSENQWLIY